ncbi:hypothetical protein [Actinoplanes sp. NPDC049599]|uniref:hypothetical protein n=1 Tax=Actinoplanes sp. NPDC049599 TaxID=3363903 RepID=UPI003790C084
MDSTAVARLDSRHSMNSPSRTGTSLRMPTKVALLALAVAAMTLAGCQSDAGTDTPPPSVAATTSPASNGIDALSADKILQRAEAALTGAKSFRARGTLHRDGEKVAIDLRVSGPDFAGSMSFGKAGVDLLAVDGKQYLRPDKEFWIMSTDARQGTLLARAMGDRWVTGADRDASFADLFTVGSLDGLFRPTEELRIGAVKDVAGVRAVGLYGDFDTRLFVASTGKPYPLQLTGKGGTELAFSDFGATFAGLAAPPANKVVDLGKLAG